MLQSNKKLYLSFKVRLKLKEMKNFSLSFIYILKWSYTSSGAFYTFLKILGWWK